MSELNRTFFGKLPDGSDVSLFHFRGETGVQVNITDFGGRVVDIYAPDRKGNVADIALGFDDLAGYVAKNPYFGALVGRYANRIANAQFQLNGHTYKLDANDPPSTLHGGKIGFDKVLWEARETEADGQPALELSHTSPDGHEGFPGTLRTRVVYRLIKNELRIDFSAVTDKKTVLNLTNHSYFDLAGQGKGQILNHVVTINADTFTPVDTELIPTGELRPVEGTPFDFRQPRRIGERIDDRNEQLKLGLGYDHNFVLNGDGNTAAFAARAVEPESGRMLEVFTTQPGVQFYTGNHLKGDVKGKGGVVYSFRTGFCLETQHFPNSPNQPNFPSTELTPGEEFRSTTIFRFAVAE